jgi:hypothetical protein
LPRKYSIAACRAFSELLSLFIISVNFSSAVVTFDEAVSTLPWAIAMSFLVAAIPLSISPIAPLSRALRLIPFI